MIHTDGRRTVADNTPRTASERIRDARKRTTWQLAPDVILSRTRRGEWMLLDTNDGEGVILNDDELRGLRAIALAELS